jgi:hypothetical protein
MASHRSTARFSAVLAVVVAIFGTGVVAGAAGSTMIIGSEANNAGAANTQLLTNSSVVAFKLLQNGPGTALMGYATPITGTTRGVYGRVDSPNGDGVQGRNAGPAGTGAAVRGYGGENAGAVLSSDADYPLELIGPANIAPMTVSSSIKVANLNADQLDGKDSTELGQVWAVVRQNSTTDCTLLRGSGATGTTGNAAENFCTVEFSRDLTNCAFIAGLSEPGGYPGADGTGEIWAF